MDLLLIWAAVPGWRCVLGTVLKFHKSYILLSRNPDKTCSVASPWRPHSAMGMWASELDQRAMGDVGFCGLVFLSRRKRAGRKTRWCLPRGCGRTTWPSIVAEQKRGSMGRLFAVGCVPFSRHIRKMVQQKLEGVEGVGLAFLIPQIEDLKDWCRSLSGVSWSLCVDCWGLFG